MREYPLGEYAVRGTPNRSFPLCGKGGAPARPSRPCSCLEIDAGREKMRHGSCTWALSYARARRCQVPLYDRAGSGSHPCFNSVQQCLPNFWRQRLTMLATLRILVTDLCADYPSSARKPLVSSVCNRAVCCSRFQWRQDMHKAAIRAEASRRPISSDSSTGGYYATERRRPGAAVRHS